MKKVTDIKYADYPACKLDLFLPECSHFPVLIFFHGGGLEMGDKEDNGDLFAILMDKGIAAVSANYRMYPDASYPDFIIDAAAAVSWVHNHIGEYGQCEDIFIAGSSAGAYLAAMICLDERYLSVHNMRPDEIAGYLFNSAQPTTHYNVLRERGMDTRRVLIDEAAPVYHIAENTNSAPILILVSDHDMPNRLEQTKLFYNTLTLFGHNARLLVMEGFEHCEYDHATDAHGNHILSTIVIQFINGAISCKTEA